MTGIERADLLRTNERRARVLRRWSTLSETVERACEIAGAIARAALLSFVVLAVASVVVNKLAVRRMTRALVVGADAPARTHQGVS